MPRRLFIGLFLLPLPLFAAPPKDELAYAVGARLGMRLQQEMPGLELSELLLGLRQAYRGEALEIPPERIEQLLLQHEDATTENTADHTRRGPLPGQRKSPLRRPRIDRRRPRQRITSWPR